jgi:hypothetical protein
MKRVVLLVFAALLPLSLCCQNLTGRWKAYEGGDGSKLVISLLPDGRGLAELSLIRRMEAVSYGEGSQFWGSFRAKGGYYFLVEGRKTADLNWSQEDSVLVIETSSVPVDSISTCLDEVYSSRNLSDFGDYKEQILAQWRQDFPDNKDVEKGHWMMEHYFANYYSDFFSIVVCGTYLLLEASDSSVTLKNLIPEIPVQTWHRIQ